METLSYGKSADYQNTSAISQFMTTHKLTDVMHHKALLKLLEYDYSIEYKKVKRNLIADALSRKDQTASSSAQVTVVQQTGSLTLKKLHEDLDSSKILQKLAQDVTDDTEFSHIVILMTSLD